MPIKLKPLLALAVVLAATSALAAGCGTKKDAPSVTGTGTSPSTGGEPSPPNGPSAPPPTGTATLTWSANTEPDLAGYKVYIGSASDTFGSLSSVANPTAPAFGSPISVGNATTFQVTNLPIGQTYKFAVAAVDTSNNESNFSNEASKFVGSGAPSVPIRQTATYYVSKTGSDNNSCAQAMNEATPKLTINAGIACLAAGDTLIVKEGIYDEIFDNPFSNTGDSWTNKITVKAESPPRSVIIRPTSGDVVMSFQSASQKYIEFDGIEVDAINASFYGVRIWGAAHHIRFKNFAILNAGDQGVSILKNAGASPDVNEFINGEVAYIAWDATTNQKKPCFASGSPRDGLCHPFYIGGDNNLIDGVNMHHSNGNGVQFFPAGNRGNTIRNSLSHDNVNVGIASIGDENRIINNVVYNNNAGGISIRETSNLIYYNTIYNNPNDFKGLNLGGTGHIVKNNLIFQNDVVVVGVVLDATNLIAITDPFVDAANENFRLKAGSDAINAGAALAEVTRDFDGIPRPQGVSPDIGAYEFSMAPLGVDLIPPRAPMDLGVL